MAKPVATQVLDRLGLLRSSQALRPVQVRADLIVALIAYSVASLGDWMEWSEPDCQRSGKVP